MTEERMYGIGGEVFVHVDRDKGVARKIRRGMHPSERQLPMGVEATKYPPRNVSIYESHHEFIPPDDLSDEIRRTFFNPHMDELERARIHTQHWRRLWDRQGFGEIRELAKKYQLTIDPASPNFVVSQGETPSTYYVDSFSQRRVLLENKTLDRVNVKQIKKDVRESNLDAASKRRCLNFLKRYETLMKEPSLRQKWLEKIRHYIQKKY
jgi:hypothetical protein